MQSPTGSRHLALAAFAAVATACAGAATSRGGLASTSAPADIVAGLEHLNELRAAAGLEPVVLDAHLSETAALHAHYLRLNAGRAEIAGLRAHHEVPELPGSTESGAEAGQRSVISFGRADARGAVDEWCATLYHRVPLLRREARAIGFAGEGGTYVLRPELDHPVAPTAPVAYPYDGQRDAPAAFATAAETPEPRPPSWAGHGFGDAVLLRSGFPVTLTFDPRAQVRDVRGSLRDGAGRPVEVALSSPQSPARADHPQGNVVAMLPRRRLTAGGRYDVEVHCEVDGAQRRFAWSFAVSPPTRLELATPGALARASGVVQIESMVEHVHTMELCDDPAGTRCRSVVVVRLESGPPPAPSVEVLIPEEAAANGPALGLIGRRVRVVGDLEQPVPGSGRIQLDDAAALTVLPDELPELSAEEPSAIAAHVGSFVWLRGTLGAHVAPSGSPAFVPLSRSQAVFLSLGDDVLAEIANRAGVTVSALAGRPVRVRGHLRRGQPDARSTYVVAYQADQVEVTPTR